eukprot:TRINITY_DN9383_c0_g1_i5.p1 TRINITY_DN9383_c0_g1~~TRINITY_DN9383_c0_g1_i5.p1  ORF type:complete len:551 (-),score=97.29 TRINITY_DN9383_c0_g1_i5:142-1794(-)
MDSSRDDADALDPHPDIHDLFRHYNTLYFDDALGPCLLTWSSKRMTLCAGVCHYEIGGGCEIRLSEPLLKFRSSADVKNTLLHEMIHAYLWITNNNKDHSDHGLSFQKLMNKINSSSVMDHQRPDGGYNITIFHSFHDEVNSYRVHHWVCQSCGDLIKRAMNREPSPSDCIVKAARSEFCGYSSCHWHIHKMSCGGEYKKIAEPPGYKDNRKRSKGNLGCDGASAQKRHKGVKVKNESDVHKLNTLENFYPTRSEANKNLGSTSWSSDDLQNNLDFDDFHEPDSMVSTRSVRKSARIAHNEERIKDKPDNLKSITARNSNPVTSKANRTLDGPSSSGYDLQNSLNFNEGGSEDETWNHVAPEQKSELQGKHGGRKKRKCTHVGGKNKIRKLENCTVIIKWKNWYANEEEEDDMEPLRNKRTERRSKQKLLKNPTDVVLKAEPLEDASHVSSNSGDILASLFKNNHGSEGEDGPPTGHVNTMKQSNIVVDHNTEARTADFNDCIDYCQKDPHTGKSINHSATSRGLVDVSGNCRSTNIMGGDIDVIDLSDG